MFIRDTLRVFAVVTALVLVSACVRHGAALIVSEPEGAEVVDLSDDIVLGVTPVKVWWKDREHRLFVNVRLQKEGYLDKTTSFWVNLDHATRDEALDSAAPVKVILDKQGE